MLQQRQQARIVSREQQQQQQIGNPIQPSADDIKLRQQHEMELLSLQHEIRSKNTKIKQLQSKYDQLENNFKFILDNHKELINRLGELERDLKDERERSSELQNKIQLQQIEITKLSDSEEKNKKLRQEIESLRKVNKNLQDTLLDTEKLKEKKQNKKYETLIEQLKQEIKQWNDKFSEQHVKYTKIVAKYKNQETQLETMMEKKEKKSVPTQTNSILTISAEVQTLIEKKPASYAQSVQVNIEPEVKREVKPPPPIMDWKPPVQIYKEIEPFVDVVKSNYKPEVIIIEKPTLRKPPIIEKPIYEELVLPKQEPPKEKPQTKPEPKYIPEDEGDRMVTILHKDLPQPREIKVNFVQTHSENQCQFKLFNTRPNMTHFSKEWSNLPFFLSVDFFKHETQLSGMTYGITNELAFEKLFEFENNTLFMYYIANGYILVQLTIAHSIDNCEVVGQVEIPLAGFIKDGKSNVIKGTANIIGKANKTIMATIDYEIRLKDPIANVIANFKSENVLSLFSDQYLPSQPITDHTNNNRYSQYDTQATTIESTDFDNGQTSYLDEELLNQQMGTGESF
ncbi:predicted protein [Naegleria gruberi]|uniref:Predicted protein n=1 Tax=Naegleria gruberi TaxID=5762 RepID=D2UYP7_NAEGR|nr:uncharacterized protein NAEGRDRAFT_61544 [Naegleria gruberi]EFC50827.1 predicted protein [Naegleria gruberi]|eukprot:XP_002683571.1 predicted protein [Naegleria gruberi strain NEG-M]